jgi:hypothetical protein
MFLLLKSLSSIKYFKLLFKISLLSIVLLLHMWNNLVIVSEPVKALEFVLLIRIFGD